MDAVCFDALTRWFSARASRRATFGVAGAALSAALGVAETAANKCKKPGQNCDNDQDCCDGAECKNDKCKCKDGRSRCGNKCKNLDNDEKHCGACDNDCRAGERCCDGDCADLLTDRDNCATCGAACASDEICLAGVCIPCPIGNQVCGDVCCPPFLTCCDDTCRNLDTNEDHCGACDNDCGAGERCCDGECVDLYIDPDNCGACGNTCDEFEANCVGFCTGDGNCPAGADPCSGEESVACAGDCVCSQSTEGGTLCGDPATPGAQCGQCESSSDCAAFGDGTFCMRTDTVECCQGGAPNVCRRICTD